jgi:hypothetical protein
MKAESKGKFINRLVKEKYQYERLKVESGERGRQPRAAPARIAALTFWRAELAFRRHTDVGLKANAVGAAVVDSFDSESDFNTELESVIGSVVVQAREQADANR